MAFLLESTSPIMRSRGVTLVLGPTNTGKTYLAIDRLLAHESGMIGLPLRLLAREVYARAIEKVPPDDVALITGEEKIKPPNPRYWICTVEAMPTDVDAAFVAIDEIQIAENPERGAIFTDRILRLRGENETLLVGSDPMLTISRRLFPRARFVTRPRMSQLTYSGHTKLARLPRRSAVVAFSVSDVYALAERMRAIRGGVAVVMGALSPKARNSQVALFESGEVDTLVATDAIGMGLNLDIDHLAFASTTKFDGITHRRLRAAEIAQIAGRAGRNRRDGTFGTCENCEPFDEAMVRTVEENNFADIGRLFWRNPHLDYSSIAALLDSVATPPPDRNFVRFQHGPDARALEIVSCDPEILRRSTSPDQVKRLWSVCQLPDYRKILPEDHAAFVSNIYRFLSDHGKIPSDFIAEGLRLSQSCEDDLDLLSQRISYIRTWSFVANQPEWLDDPLHWQGETRRIEEQLSDELHRLLTARFVDKQSRSLKRKVEDGSGWEIQVGENGEVFSAGACWGHLHGLQWSPTEGAGRRFRSAIRPAIEQILRARREEIVKGNDGDFSLEVPDKILWKGQVIGQLISGARSTRPDVRVPLQDGWSPIDAERPATRIRQWVDTQIGSVLAPYRLLETAPESDGTVRSLIFRLKESFGLIPRSEIRTLLHGLDRADRKKLRALGIRFGAQHIFLPELLKPKARRWILILQYVASKGICPSGSELPTLLNLIASGRTSVARQAGMNLDRYLLAGFRMCGNRAVRVDILEQLCDKIRDELNVSSETEVQGGFRISPFMCSLLGCPSDELESVFRWLRFRPEPRKCAPPPLAPVAESQAPTGLVGSRLPDTDDNADTGDPEQSGTAQIVLETRVPDPATEDLADRPPKPSHKKTETWWVPQARSRRARGAKAREPKTRSQPRTDGRSRGAGSDQAMPDRSSRVGSSRFNRPTNPDSPFAVLARLRESPASDRRKGKPE